MTSSSTYPRLEELLPHRKKMLLIDEIVYIDGDRAASRATPNHQWPQSDGSTVPCLLLIELIAQTSGLNNGLECLNNEGRGTPINGWLVGIKKATLHLPTIALGENILTETKNRFKFEDFREIEGYCKIGEKTIGEATLQVLRTR